MNSAPDFDAAVIGGGPAGATAARWLAQSGLATCLLEREKPPRYKTCGGGLVRRAARLLEVDLEGVVERSCCAAELRLQDAGLAFRVERDEPLVLMTMRAELDARLLDGARAHGAEVWANRALDSIEERRDSVILHTSAAPLCARYVLGCDGALGTTARAAGFAAHSRAIPALEAEIAVAPKVLERFAQSARFDFGALESGYAWVFPKRAHLSVGCLSTRRGARGLKLALDRYVDELGLDASAEREDHGFLIPIAPRPGPLARGRVLLAGDAAGLADPITCEGISNAIQSARLAAEAVAAHLDRPERVRREYERGLALHILPELRSARRLAPLLYDRPALRARVFRRAGQVLCESIAEVIAGERGYRELFGRPASWLALARRFVAS